MIIVIFFISRDIGIVEVGIEIVKVVIETAVDGGGVGRVVIEKKNVSDKRLTWRKGENNGRRNTNTK